jgi:lysophospholipase L1-like esterase
MISARHIPTGIASLALLWLAVLNHRSEATIASLKAEMHGTEGGRVELRTFMIKSQIAQAKNPVIVMGDSITEAALLPSSICGHDVVNAGVGGMTVESFAPIAREVLPARADAIILALGINDSFKGGALVNYGVLFDAVRDHADMIIVAGLAPLAPLGPLAKSYFDSNLAEQNDTMIAQFAANRSLPFIDLHHEMQGDDLTVDGVHLNGGGYLQWTGAVVAKIRGTICPGQLARGR